MFSFYPFIILHLRGNIMSNIDDYEWGGCCWALGAHTVFTLLWRAGLLDVDP